MQRAARQFFSIRSSKALPLSTLLLAALCVLLAAPSSQASAKEYSSREAILSVLQRGELSASLLQEVLAPQSQSQTQLSIFEVRRLREVLSQLDKTQLIELQKQLASLDAFSIESAALPSSFAVASTPQYSSLPSHFAAQLNGIRTNRFLE